MSDTDTVIIDEISDSNKIEIDNTNEIDLKTNEIDLKTNEIDSKTSEIDSKTNEIDSKTNEIDSKTDELLSKKEECKEYCDELNTKDEIEEKMDILEFNTSEIKNITELINYFNNVIEKQSIKRNNDYIVKLENILTNDLPNWISDGWITTKQSIILAELIESMSFFYNHVEDIKDNPPKLTENYFGEKETDVNKDGEISEDLEDIIKEEVKEIKIENESEVNDISDKSKEEKKENILDLDINEEQNDKELKDSNKIDEDKDNDKLNQIIDILKKTTDDKDSDKIDQIIDILKKNKANKEEEQKNEIEKLQEKIKSLESNATIKNEHLNVKNIKDYGNSDESKINYTKQLLEKHFPDFKIEDNEKILEYFTEFNYVEKKKLIYASVNKLNNLLNFFEEKINSINSGNISDFKKSLVDIIIEYNLNLISFYEQLL